MSFLSNLANIARQKATQVYHAANTDYQHIYNDVAHSAPVQTAQRVVAQVNPLDGGRTYQHPMAVHPQASAMQQLTHNGATNAIGRDIVKPAYHFMRDGGTIGAAHPGYRNFSRGLTLAAERSLLGTGQDVSGLVNMATQHTLNPAPNRFDNLLNRTAQGVDSQAKNFHVNPIVYKVAQAAGDLAQFAIGSGELKAGAKVLSSVPKVGGVVRAAGTVGKAIEVPGQRIAQLGKGGNIGQRIAAKTAGNILSPKYQAANAAFTAMQSGKDASHGIQQTPQSLAVNTAIGGVGFPLAGAAGSEIGRSLLPGTKAAGQAVIKGSKTVGRDVKAAQAKVSRNDGIIQQQKALDKEYAALQQRMQNTPVNNAIANNNFMAKLDRNRAQHAALESQKVKLSAKDKLLTAQPGLSMKPVKGTPPDPLAALKQEALKYKSADEFAGAVRQNQSLFDTVAQHPFRKMNYGETTGGYSAAKARDFYNQAHAEAKASAPKATPAPAPPKPSAKRQLPASRGTGGGSSANLKRSQLTGKALSTPTKELTKPSFTPNPAKGIYTEPTGRAKAAMTPESYASTFGVSKEQAIKELAKANEKAKTRPTPKQPPKPLTAAENTAKNPTKVSLPKVEEGNYEQARLNPQIASHPVNYATGQTLDAIKAAGINDTSTFAKMVEGDIKPSNAREAAAVQAYRDLSNRVHATSQALGGNTPYVENYFRHEWDLSDPNKAAEFNKLASKGNTVDPYAFGGLDRQPRVFKSVAEGEKAGFKLANPNLKDEVADYGSGSAYALKQQALAKALTEADMGEANKPHTFDLGGGKSIILSDKGMKEAKGYAKSLPTDNKAVRAYRKGNRGFKQILLSVSQFHPINISVLRAAPTLTAEGHPLRGGKGLFDTFAAQASKDYSHKLQTAAMRDANTVLDSEGNKTTVSTLEASSRIGSPIKFGSDYSAESKVGFGNGGLGEKAIFERAMPAMHIQMVKSAIEDLTATGKSLDSKEAHALGTRINEIMGFVNTEARNLDRGTQRRLGDIFLAPQFTRAKWATNKGALTQGGLAGSYARRSIVANSAASAVVALLVGYALSQKSDNINDILLRSIFHPSVPTPLKDNKGNTMELGLPSTQSSEVLGLLGASLQRGTDGHLHVKFSPQNVPGNTANYGRSRLAILPGDGLKVATNTNYAGKPLYDPSASMGTKIAQAGTTLVSNGLPIGLQGVIQTNAVKQHLPQSVQQVITANTPGANPVVKSIGSSFGLTPRTDQTVGKGQQTAQYFGALDNAKRGLNSQEQAAMTMVTGSKKNPVTGLYEVKPSSDDSRAKATALLQNPKVIDKLQQMNQTLARQGQSTDPLWSASKDQITKYYQYQAMPPGSADKTDWMNKNKDWYTPIAQARNNFFNSLPPGDPNKPQSPIQYPNASPAVANLQKQYDGITDSSSKGDFIAQHPELLTQWQKQADYTNEMRVAQGYAPYKNSPQASSQLQSYMDKYNAADKATRKSIRNSNPQAYQAMIAYYDAVDLYNINKQGAVNQLQGEPDQTSKQNKAISSLARDIYQNPDGTYSIVPAGWMNGLSNESAKGGFKAYKSHLGAAIKAAKATSTSADKYAVAKVQLSSKMKPNTISAYKKPTLRLRKTA